MRKQEKTEGGEIQNEIGSVSQNSDFCCVRIQSPNSPLKRLSIVRTLLVLCAFCTCSGFRQRSDCTVVILATNVKQNLQIGFGRIRE